MTEDQVIDAGMAQALQVDACRASPMVGWLRDAGSTPGKIVARLVTATSTPYVLVADMLGELARGVVARPDAVGAPAGGPARGGGDVVHAGLID